MDRPTIEKLLEIAANCYACVENEDVVDICNYALELEAKVKRLEIAVAIAHDYLKCHWDMDADPLRVIKEITEQALNADPPR